MKTIRLTMAQALTAFLKRQFVERDAQETQFFAGVWGIFGHGNLTGIGQALHQDMVTRSATGNPELPYYLGRNEQGMVHLAAGFAKMRNRLSTFACATSVGPGSTNMITGAAAATINRLPVLLLPADVFARRNVAPALQQLESESTQDISVNDAFKPVSRYWDRINRADQLPYALAEAMRVLTSPVQTGAVTLALPEDVQTEAWDYPVSLFEKHVWHIPRPLADRAALQRAVEWIRAARAPLVIAGGGVQYSDAHQALARFVEKTGIAVGETQAGKGSLPFNHPQQLGVVGIHGMPGANIVAREADLVIAIGTRLADTATASKTAFQHPDVRFINVNVAEFDAHKIGAMPLVADARVTLEELTVALEGYRVASSYSENIVRHARQWESEVDRICSTPNGTGITQSKVIGVLNSFSRPEDVVVSAAGSIPADLLKFWRTQRPGGFHIESGFACMGYEISGALGAKMADPSREVYVVLGDGCYQMLSSEIVTSIQEGYKLNIVLLDNNGFGSIGGLSKAVGDGGFGTQFRFRNRASGQMDGAWIPVDFAANAASYGAHVICANNPAELEEALKEARLQDRTTVIVVKTDMERMAPGLLETWWDVPVAEVSEVDAVRAARKNYEIAVKRERYF
jgi:3D-(3,5/4)-trihydroxycyclohexane-1,2-dione acylhydrolase (decyclizing)